MNNPTGHDRPFPTPPMALIIIAQIAVAIVIGAASAYLGTVIGEALFFGERSGFGDIVASLLGMIIAYPLGVVAAIAITGKLLSQPGSIGRALIGAYLGVGVVLLLARFLLIGNVTFGWIVLFSLGLIGAMLGYYRWPQYALQRITVGRSSK